MSKHETPMLLEYWKQTGGVLIEEFLVVKKNFDKLSTFDRWYNYTW